MEWFKLKFKCNCLPVEPQLEQRKVLAFISKGQSLNPRVCENKPSEAGVVGYIIVLMAFPSAVSAQCGFGGFCMLSNTQHGTRWVILAYSIDITVNKV